MGRLHVRDNKGQDTRPGYVFFGNALFSLLLFITRYSGYDELMATSQYQSYCCEVVPI